MNGNTVVASLAAVSLLLSGCASHEATKHDPSLSSTSFGPSLATEECKVRAVSQDPAVPGQLLVALDEQLGRNDSGVWNLRLRYTPEQLPGQNWKGLQDKVIIVVYDRTDYDNGQKILDAELIAVRP